MSGQGGFVAALRVPGAAPQGLTSWNGSDPAQRFDVYRNNVVASRVEALAAAFPVVKALVGEDFFAGTARSYITAEPPGERVMIRFGRTFPDFLDSFPPAQSLPWLGDVARIEAARLAAHHAADVLSAGPEAFMALEPSRLGDMRVTPHPSLAVLPSRWSAFSIWAAHQDGGALEGLDPDGAEASITLRRGYEVETRRLGAGCAAALLAMAQGARLSAAIAAAADDPDFEPSAFLTLLVADGLAQRVWLEPEE